MTEDRYIAGNRGVNFVEKLIVVSGCSGGGKSSLLSEMARRGYDTKPEPGRQIVKEQIYVGGDGVPWRNAEKFIERCVSRAVYFYNSARLSDGPVLFDRCVVDAVTAHSRLGLPTPPHMANTLAKYRYAPVIFMAMPWKELFNNDLERRHSFTDAVAEFEALVESYPAQGYAVKRIPKSSIHERADFLEQQLDAHQTDPAGQV